MIFELEDGRLEVPGNGAARRRRAVARARRARLARRAERDRQDDAASRRSPASRALDGGKLRSGHNVKLGYLSQHTEELGAGGARTVLEACAEAAPGLPPNQARALLGRFLFSGEEADKPLDGLSGGERRRLSLAILVSSGANVLILDEPTNHLDLESREALEDALRVVPGLAPARHPRPRAARRGRHAHGRDRGPAR